MLNPYVEMPPWLLALQQALHGDGPDPSADELTPLAALTELVALAKGPAPESSDDRVSLQADVGRALGLPGQAMQAAAKTAVAEFRRHTLGRLPKMVSTMDGAGLAAAAADVLADRLCESDVVTAAWRDVVGAFEGGAAYQVCADRLGVLRELVEARGHIVEAETERLARIINDSAEHISQAGGRVPPPADGENYRIDERAQYDERARLDVIEQYLAKPAAEEPIVVWLLFFDAVVTDEVVELGSVRFIDARHLRKQLGLRAANPEEFGLPAAQLGLFMAAQLLEDVGEEDQAVIARVATTTRRGQAVDWARRTATAFLDTATLGQPKLGWHLAEGHLLQGDSSWSHRRLSRKGVPDLGRLFTRFMFRPDKSLAALDEKLVQAWVAGRADAVEAIELARWNRAVASLPDPHFRVALSVRNLERALPGTRLATDSGGSHWTGVASYYLKERWCWAAIEAELNEVCLHAVSAAYTRAFDPEHELAGSVTDEVGPFYDGLAAIMGSREMPNPRELVTHVDSIRHLTEPGSSRRRILDALASDTVDPQATVRWLARLARQFDILVARTARQRNALLHGGGTSSSVLGSSLTFVEDLGVLVVKDVLAAAAAAVPVSRLLEERRLKAHERSAALTNGNPLAKLL